MPGPLVLRVAIPAPLRHVFDYLAPSSSATLSPGVRVRVPFGRRKLIGILLEVNAHSALPHEKLKSISEILDATPLLTPETLALLRWAADYYHHPIGEVVFAALPALLRRGAPAHAGIETWMLTAAGQNLALDQFKRAPSQKKLWETLRASENGLAVATLAQISNRWRPVLRRWQAQGWVNAHYRDCLTAVLVPCLPAPALTAAQHEAVQAISAELNHFRCFLLHGITGSGKTEVYLQLVEKVLASGRQVLVLVPEIGLTPQLAQRFQQRFNVPIALLHSGLNDGERLCAWLSAGTGKAPIVLGTRSAVFVPLHNLGLIVVDEEHDVSYKQQDGFRYHARDLAVLRGQRQNIPVVLGSATPSLESLHHARARRYHLLTLPDRTGRAGLPQVHLLDLRRLAVIEGLSPPLLQAVAARLARGEQSLLFLNRRGFAPVLWCKDCGWLAPCRRCDARLTLHQRSGRLRCHHCGADHALPVACPACGGTALHGIGAGTQRVEAVLARQFPQARVLRIDRDSTGGKGALQAQLAQAQAGAADILIGTQMLSKGHNFPNVTLVGILNADQGLYGLDFRAPEQLFQQIMQVAGRAGRGDLTGEVLIQTHHPDSPLFDALRLHDYAAFADYALQERSHADYPPFAYLALLRAESPQEGTALAFLRTAAALGAPLARLPVRLMDPTPSPMERRAGRHRAQLLVQSSQRSALHAFLQPWLAHLESGKQSRQVRWSLDVDPMVMY